MMQRSSHGSRDSAGVPEECQVDFAESPETVTTMRESSCGSRVSAGVPEERQIAVMLATMRSWSHGSQASGFSEAAPPVCPAPPELQASFRQTELKPNMVVEVVAKPAFVVDDRSLSITSVGPEEPESFIVRSRSSSPDLMDVARSFVLKQASWPLPYSSLSPEAAEEREHDATIAPVRCHVPVMAKAVLHAAEQPSPSSEERAANFRAFQATRALQTMAAAATASSTALQARKKLHRAKENPLSLLAANSKSVSQHRADMDFRGFQRRVARLAGQAHTGKRVHTPEGRASSAPSTARSARSAQSVCSRGVGAPASQARINLTGCALQIQDSHSWCLSVKPDPEQFAHTPRSDPTLIDWARPHSLKSQPATETDLAPDFLPDFFRLSDEERHAGPRNDPKRFEHRNAPIVSPTICLSSSAALFDPSDSEPAFTNDGFVELKPLEANSFRRPLTLPANGRYAKSEASTSAGSSNGCSRSSSIPTLTASGGIASRAASAGAGTSNDCSSSSSFLATVALAGITASTPCESDNEVEALSKKPSISSLRRLPDTVEDTPIAPDVFDRLFADAERWSLQRSSIEEERPRSVRELPSSDHDHIVRELQSARRRASSGRASSRGLQPRAVTEGAAPAWTGRVGLARPASMCDLTPARRSGDDPLDRQQTLTASPDYSLSPVLRRHGSESSIQKPAPCARSRGRSVALLSPERCRPASLSPVCFRGRGH